MTSKQISDFLSFLRECEERFHMAEADEQEANALTQDLLHSLELEEHGYRSCALLAKELRTVRQQCRKAKDTLSQTLPVLSWLEENRSVIKSLERLLGDVRKAERCCENRIDTPRRKPA